jgi:hypothetical protein
MPKTAVGLSAYRDLVDEVVREIEGPGFPRKELTRDLSRIGVAKTESQADVEGLRRGGAMKIEQTSVVTPGA